MINIIWSAQVPRQRSAGYVQGQLTGRDGVNAVAQLFANEQAEDLEGRLEPERCGNDEHFLQSGWISSLQVKTETSFKRTNWTEVIVK